jgi:putative membrane protein
MMFGFVLLLIVVFYMFNLSNAGGQFFTSHQSMARNSLDILDDRYARSEINREDYLERKQELLAQK